MRFIVLILWLFLVANVHAQDLILKLDGDSIQARVLEIGLSDVSFNDPNDSLAVEQRVNLLEVKEVQYQDGVKEKFASSEIVIVKKNGDTIFGTVDRFRHLDILYKLIDLPYSRPRKVMLFEVEKVIFPEIRSVRFFPITEDKVVLESGNVILGEITNETRFDLFLRRYTNAPEQVIPIYKVDEVVHETGAVKKYDSNEYKDPRTGAVRYRQRGSDRVKREKGSGFAFNEEQKNAFYTRIGLYEISLGYQRRLSEKTGLGIELDYRPAFVSSYRNNLRFLSWNIAQEAYRAKGMVNYYKNERTYFSFVLSYRYLYANKLIYDPGHFSGSNTSDYSVYSQKNHEFGLSFFLNKPLLQTKSGVAKSKSPHEWYVGAGLVGKALERHYSIDGYYSGQFPSDKVTRPFLLVPTIYFGFKLKFARF